MENKDIIYFNELEVLRILARKDHIPIIRDESLEELVKILKIKKPKKVLELGTAIGYSTILISKNIDENANIISIEKDEERIKNAKKNLEENLVRNVKIISSKIEDYIDNLENEKFDFIFLDGPKSHYLEYVKKLEKNLEENAIIFSDDILYFGKVKKDGIIEKKHRTIVVNLRKYINYMLENKDFKTEILDKANGIMISEYIKNGKN